MKNYLAICAWLALFLCQNSCSQNSAASPEEAAAMVVSVSAGKRNAEEMVAEGYKRYGVEKGIVVYKLEGAVTGTEVIYFDQWGWREGKYERYTAKFGAFEEKINKVQYLDGERRYQFDPKTNTANYFDSPQVQAASNKLKTKNMVEVGKDMMKKMGGFHKGNEEVADADCEIWWLLRYNTKLWMWEGLTMKEVSNIKDVPIQRTAISLKTEVEVPLKKMTLPPDVKEVKLGEPWMAKE
jgi:hypothetical protein